MIWRPPCPNTKKFNAAPATATGFAPSIARRATLTGDGRRRSGPVAVGAGEFAGALIRQLDDADPKEARDTTLREGDALRLAIEAGAAAVGP